MTLADLFKKRPIKTIGVVGMGYVGIPSALLFADVNAYKKVYGFQRNSKSSGYKIDMLNRGESPLKGNEPGLDELLKRMVLTDKFECTSDFSKIADCDAVTLAIQTPFCDKGKLEPDLGALNEGLSNIGLNLTKGSLVVIESTVTPGTTDGYARLVLEGVSGLTAGVDFGLAHAPERVMVGSLLTNIYHHDRVIGGIDPVSTERAVQLYRPVLKYNEPIRMSAKAAEVTKTAENAFRDLQIAAVNELALLCEAMGINVYDVRRGIDSLKGKGVSREILYPGAGVGGHCLTKDTYHLIRGLKNGGAKALDELPNIPSLFITARGLNDFMPVHMYNLTVSALDRIGSTTSNKKIALLGWAFMADTDDARDTPSERYMCRFLKDKGVQVTVHDPYVRHPSITDKLDDAIRDADVIAIFTAHKQYRDLNPVEIKGMSGKPHPVIIDGRNVIDPDKFIQHGFVYKGIGRGDKNNHEIYR